MTSGSATTELHIASFVVQHRREAAAALTAAMAVHSDLELARSSEFRSIVLCESDDRHALIDRMETLRAVPGVLNVALVYHHAEPRAALDEPMPARMDTGAAP